jgi:hypothetical protein
MGYTKLYVQNEPCSMYYYNPTLKEGIEGERDATSLGAPMMVMNSAQENSDVYSALLSQGVLNLSPEIWMGITDSGTTYTWRTFAGQAAPAYTNWAAGDPNNLPPGCKVGNSCLACLFTDAYWCANGEDCAVMNASGLWLDNTCASNSVKRITVLELNTCPVLIKPADMTVCAGGSVTLTARDTFGSPPYTYTWNPGGLTGQTVTITPTATDTITVQASDKFHCLIDSTVIITINPTAVTANAGPDVQVCPGTASILGTNSTPGYTYSWSPAWGLSSTTVAEPIFTIASSPGATAIDTNYILTAMLGGCSARDTVHVTLYPNINNNFTTSSSVACGNDNLTVTYAGTASGTATYNWNFDSATVATGSGAGPYQINWINFGQKNITLNVSENGCTAAPVSDTITVYPKPSPSFSISGLTLTTNTYASYQWLLNGQPISGENTQSITADMNGNYQVIVTDSNGCTDTSAIRTITNVGIQELTAQDMIRIYPNPNNGTFIVQTYKAIGGEITISDLLGRIIMKQAIITDKQSISLGTSDGEYLVTIRVNGRTYTGRMLVSKE